MRRSHLRAAAVGLTLYCLAGAPAFGWGAHGHRTVTRLALDGLAAGMPSWLRDPAVVARIADQSNEPDRWRGTPATALNNAADPEHYIDVEDLEQYGLTLEGLPRPRYEYVRQMAVAKVQTPERILPYDAAKDPDRGKEWPGFIAHAIDEHFAKLVSSFNTLRVLEAMNDPARAGQLQQARENVVYEMGILSHYVGDSAQPLHTTRHHHGWVGENPSGYTTNRGIHSYIDTGVVERHGLTFETLRPLVKYEQAVTRAGVWEQSLAYIRRSFEQVEPLYRMQKDDTLDGAPGKAMIEARLCDAAGFLAALYNAAWEASAPSDRDIANFVRYSEMKKPGAQSGGK